MSVLTDGDILEAMGFGDIIIKPFDSACLGTNSYDVHLAPTLRVYDRKKMEALDVRSPTSTIDIPLLDDGLILQPGRLYLASTVEYTESRVHVPVLNGRSSLGRLGLSIHVTAGTGDVGFCGAWTMELFVIEPLRIYAGIPIGQLLWFNTESEPLVTYDRKPWAKYNKSGALPQPSKLHEELSRKGDD